LMKTKHLDGWRKQSLATILRNRLLNPGFCGLSA
jgi:hypothetical protein